MLDLTSVRLFILAVEFGNLTRAAEAAGTVQPAVSARLKGLEAALGRKLLERTPRFVRPTDDGLAFLAKAHALMAAHDEATRFDDAPSVRIVIGASDHALGTGLEHVIRHVRAALPARSLVELSSMPSSYGGRPGARTARCWVWIPSAGARSRMTSLGRTAPSPS
jgi:DNA-binding transcriptional LysR family regulator